MIRNLLSTQAGFALLLGISGLLGWLWPDFSNAQAGEKPVYRDIYLTEERICRSCSGRWIDDKRLELANRQGEKAIIASKDIIGIDKHPVARRILTRSLHGIGLSAKIVVPYAFEDWEEFVCKYCNDDPYGD